MPPLALQDGLIDGVDVTSWEEQTFLTHGALLAKSCEAAMLLAKHDKQSQTLAHLYGKHLSLGHKVSLTHRPFLGPPALDTAASTFCCLITRKLQRIMSFLMFPYLQLNSDLQPFVKGGVGEPLTFSLNAAPVVFHRQIVGEDRWHQHLQQVQLQTVCSTAGAARFTVFMLECVIHKPLPHFYMLTVLALSYSKIHF